MLRIVWITFGVCFTYILISYSLLTWIWLASDTLITYDEHHFNNTLEKILVPRFPGSYGHYEVCEFVATELVAQGFDVIQDRISEPVPLTNVVGIMNPAAQKFLLLSCHYDSKYMELDENFVGATDGGVPCAILLNMARNINVFLRSELAQQKDIGLLLVFFDGHDSMDGGQDDTYPLYGSRSFVNLQTVPLKRIELVISLKLIGVANMIFMSRYQSTYKLHEHMADIEEELGKLGRLSKCEQLFYKLKDHNNDLDDDHISFLEKGIPVMHVISHAYPELWHQSADNLENIHWPTVRNMNAIITKFVYDYIKNYKVAVK